jgi:arabinofuranosyltransferase
MSLRTAPPPPGPRWAGPWAEVARFAPLALAALVLVWHAQQYDFVTDDAYISFVFARNLAEHGALVFNLGDPVEGYTNFLWTFGLGLLMVVGIPPELASRIAGVGFGLGVLAMSFRLAERLLGRGHPLAALPALLLASSSGFACWSSGGLETQLYTFLIMVALDGYLAATDGDEAGGLRRMAIALALAAMTRPEGLLIAGLIVVHRLASNLLLDRRLAPRRTEWLAAGWFLALWAPWFAWRAWYYGWPFPNTYYVKAAGAAAPGYDAKMRANGWHYVGRWFTQTGLAWAAPLAVVGLIARPAHRVRFAFVSLAALIAVVYLRYVVGVGGDFMGLHRFIMPLFPLAALALTLGLVNVGAAVRLPGGVARVAIGAGLAIAIGAAIARTQVAPGQRELVLPWLAAGLVIAGAGVVAARGLVPTLPRSLTIAIAVAGGLAVLVPFALRQRELTRRSLATGNYANDRGIDTPAFLRAYTGDRAKIGRALAPCVRPDDFAIFGGVGALPYYARLRGIDVFGLVSSRVAHEVPRTNPRAGHNKWGPDALMAEHQPTIVLSCYDLRRSPGVAPLGHCAGAWQARGFERVSLRVPGLVERGEHLTFLVRRDRNFSCPGLVR